MSNIETLDFTIHNVLQDWATYRKRYPNKVLAFNRDNHSIEGIADNIQQAVEDYPDCRYLVTGEEENENSFCNIYGTRHPYCRDD